MSLFHYQLPYWHSDMKQRHNKNFGISIVINNYENK